MELTADEIQCAVRAALAVAALAVLAVVGNKLPVALRVFLLTLAVVDDLGAITDVWVRWDSVWFLRLAEHGYHSATDGSAAFFPLYPATVGLLGRVFGGHGSRVAFADVAVVIGACVTDAPIGEVEIRIIGARDPNGRTAGFP